jgi:RNA binding exosome subunit
MKYAHTVAVKAFASSQDEIAELERSLTSFLPGDFEKEGISFQVESCSGFEDKMILVMALVLSKERHTTNFLMVLTNMLSSDQKRLLCAQKNRLDESLDYFIRFSKPDFLKGILTLTDGGNCVHCKIHLAAYPKTGDAAWGVVHKLFNPDESPDTL